jgi:hypothetical protein
MTGTNATNASTDARDDFWDEVIPVFCWGVITGALLSALLF